MDGYEQILEDISTLLKSLSNTNRNGEIVNFQSFINEVLSDKYEIPLDIRKNLLLLISKLFSSI